MSRIIYLGLEKVTNMSRVIQLLDRYEGLRDFSFVKDRTETEYFFYKEMAKMANATLMPVLFSRNTYSNHRVDHPTILPFSPEAVIAENMFLGHYWRQKHLETPVFLASEYYSPFTFSYCTKVSDYTTDKLSIGRLLLSPLQTDIWTLLVLTLLVTFFAFALAVLAPTLGGFPIRRHNFLMTSFLMFSFLLNFYYCGKLMANLAVPALVKHIETFKGLRDNNFTLVARDESYKNDLINFAQLPKHKFLREMLKDAVIDTNAMELLYSSDTKAQIRSWHTNLRFLDTAQRWFDDMQSVDRKCFVSKEIIEYGLSLFGFLPPHSYNVINIYKFLNVAGIYELWENEYIQISHSRRVQDRIR